MAFGSHRGDTSIMDPAARHPRATRAMASMTAVRAARAWHGLVAVLVLAALALQLWIAVRVPGSPPAHVTGTLYGAALPSRVLRVLSFFTIQSNILSGVAGAQLALDPRRDGPGWRVLRLSALVGITTTGVVYAAVLSRVHDPHGWQETSTNAVFHYVVPALMVLGWLAFGPRPRVERRTAWLALVWPALWLVYTLLHGWVSRWYPYPFIDVAALGYPSVAQNGAGVLALLLVVIGVFALGDRRLPPTAATAPEPSGTDVPSRRPSGTSLP